MKRNQRNASNFQCKEHKGNRTKAIWASGKPVTDDSCVHCLDCSHCLSPLLKTLLLVSHCTSVGREFQSLAPFTERAAWQKEGLHRGMRQSPQVDARVVALWELWRLMATSENGVVIDERTSLHACIVLQLGVTGSCHENSSDLVWPCYRCT